ncbi:MAG: extracellular solute-binding protein, partial [Arachnia sp.]
GKAGETPAKPESITYWSMWKEGEAQQVVLAAAVKSWEAETGIKVNVEWQGRGVVQKLTPALNTNKVPDIVDGAYNALAPILATTGQAASMQMAYDTEVDGKKVSELIPEKYLTKDSKLKMEDGSPWLMPYSISSEAIWFNKAEHPDWATTPPGTWDDFMKILDQVKSSGKEAPIAIDADISGYNAAWFGSQIIGEGGPGSMEKLITSKDGAAWDEPQVLEIAKRVETLAKGGYFIPGYNASKFPAQQQAWATNKAAFLLNGSWIPAETATYVADGFEFGSFPLPTNTDKKYARAEFTGYIVPMKSKNQEWAMNFAASVLSKKNQDAWGTEAKQIPVRLDAETSPEIASVIANLKNADGVFPALDGTFFPGYTDKVFFPINNELVLGKLSAEEFVSKMKQANIDYWKTQG